MPGIPIAEIPNAPRIDGPYLIRDGQPRTTDISATTKSLLTPTMDVHAYDGAGEAMQSIGKGLQNLGDTGVKVASVLSHWQATKQNSADVIASNQRDAVRADFMAKTNGEMASIPADKRPAYFQSKLPELQKTLAAIPVSARRMDQEAATQNQWEKQNYAAIYTHSTNQTIEQGKQTGLDNYYRKLSTGDVNGAFHGLDEMKSAYLLSDAQYQDQIEKGHAFVQKQHATQYLAQNPRGMLSEIDQSLKTGQPIPGFNWTDQEKRSYRQQAQSAITQREVDTSYQAQQAVLKGDLSDERSIRQATAGELPESRVASLVKLANNDPSYDPASLTKLKTAVRGFVPGSDRDKAKYDSLQTQIENTVPKAMQPALSDELYKAWQTRGQNDSTSQTRQQQAMYFHRIDSLAQNGLLSGTGPNDQANSADNAHLVGMKSEFMKSEIERFMKSNPDAKPGEIKDRLKSLLQDNGINGRAATQFRDRGVSISR
jgi:hypothetical protein